MLIKGPLFLTICFYIIGLIGASKNRDRAYSVVQQSQEAVLHDEVRSYGMSSSRRSSKRGKHQVAEVVKCVLGDIY
jgi:hypothetical protein